MTVDAPESTADTALNDYISTLGAAFASGEEASRGSITPGKLADLVVLDRDIFACPAEEILQTRVSATVLDGRVVYGEL